MSRPARSMRVPLNVDAQFRLAVGPVTLPLRSVILAAAASPVAYLLLALHLPGLWGAAGAGFVLAVAASFGLPERQGVWIGTHLLYRQAWRLFPSTVTRGRSGRARVREVAGSIHVTRERAVGRRRPGAPSVGEAAGRPGVRGGRGWTSPPEPRRPPCGARAGRTAGEPVQRRVPELVQLGAQLGRGRGLRRPVPHADDPPRRRACWGGVRPPRHAAGRAHRCASWSAPWRARWRRRRSACATTSCCRR